MIRIYIVAAPMEHGRRPSNVILESTEAEMKIVFHAISGQDAERMVRELREVINDRTCDEMEDISDDKD